MSKRFFPVLAFAGFGLSTVALADTALTPDTRVGAVAFFDFSNISNQQNSNLPGAADVAPSGTGFDIKRLYLTVDHTFNEVFSADLTTDAQFSSSTTAGSGGVTEVFIKRLFLQAKIDDALVVRAGAYNTPWAQYVEGLYGYRWVEKTMLDRLGFLNTADWGLNAGGALVKGLTYSASVVNGAGFKNPSRSKTPDVEARVAYSPLQGLSIGLGGYVGHLGQVTVANEKFAKNTASRWDAAIGYTIAGLHVGGEYFDAKNYKTVNSLAAGVYGTSAVVAATATGAVPKDEANGGSIWASYDFGGKYSVFARGDVVKLSKDVLPGLKDKYVNVGVDYKPIKNVDVALVYKNEKVQHGSASLSGADAGGSVVIGGSNAANDGKYSEIGIFLNYTW
ncbi:MAG: carbohydrate porin [Pseudomonadota bacterium]|nr:carbohydrate porin [Pseudomonadota bacterium]